jgi:hypothetical protein
MWWKKFFASWQSGSRGRERERERETRDKMLPRTHPSDLLLSASLHLLKTLAPPK